MPLMNDTNGPTDMGSQIGKASKIGFLAQKMIGGLAKNKKKAAAQMANSKPTLSSRTYGKRQIVQGTRGVSPSTSTITSPSQAPRPARDHSFSY